MNKQTHEMLARVYDVLRRHHPTDGPRHSIEQDGQALRRISMMLHRWHELECGDSNAHASWCITRGRKEPEGFVYDDGGKPFNEIHYNNGLTVYQALFDREAGALKRLAKIMAHYPTLRSYIQTDPRGASLYILRPGDVPDGCEIDAYYSRGVAVYK